MPRRAGWRSTTAPTTAEIAGRASERSSTSCWRSKSSSMSPTATRFLAACGALVKPGGAFIGATLNRTPQSFALAIVGAEYVLRWLPRGTHDWRRFLRPSEFVLGLRRAGLGATRLAGSRYRLAQRRLGADPTICRSTTW